MVNTMDLGRGFLKLQEDNNSRRSSSLFRHKPLELNESGLHYVTRINCGCGQCVPFRVKVEKDDGGLRIGKLTLATNCHLVIVIFGFFFLIAGSVLTALAYKEPVRDPDLPVSARASKEQLDSPSRQEGKVAGPIFIIVGSALVLVGFTLTALACKLNREAKRQLQLSRFTWETPPITTPDIFSNGGGGQHHNSTSSEHFAMFANNTDSYSVRSREFSTCSANSTTNGGGRRDSSFTFSRQGQHPPPPLSTIAQAVPVGVFLFNGGPDSATSPRSPTIQVTDPSGFQEIELGSPTTESAPTSAAAYRSRSPDVFRKQHRSQSDGANVEDVSRASSSNVNNRLNPNNDPSTVQAKVNLALRPSLPIIPMFASQNSATSPHYFSRVTPLDPRNLYVSSRSDEPFGSIASLSTSGDIACFPITSPPPSSATLSGPLSNSEQQQQRRHHQGIANGTLGNGGGGVVQPTPEECDENNTSPIASSKNTNNSYGANNSNNNERNRNDSITSSKNKTSENMRHVSQGGISELPPINVNEYGSKIKSGNDGGNGGAGFRPKSILRQTKSEDWNDDGGGGGSEVKSSSDSRNK